MGWAAWNLLPIFKRDAGRHNTTRVSIQGQIVTYVEETFAGISVQDCIRKARQKHVGLDIEAIDDEMVLGFCETCGKPLFGHNEFLVDVDGVCWCTSHDSVLED